MISFKISQDNMSASANFTTKHGKYVRAPLEFNVSNSNAIDILTVLGFTADLTGESKFKIQEFKKGIDLFLCSDLPDLVDGARPAATVGNITKCARREDYLVEKVEILYNLCEKAEKLGAEFITFC